MKRSSAELKQLARATLKGKYGIFIGTFVLLEIISSAIVMILGFTLPGLTWTAIITRQLISMLSSVIISIFSAGLMKQGLNAVRDLPLNVGDIFYGFKNHPDRIIVVQLLLVIISLVCSIPALALFIYIAIGRFVYYNVGLIVLAFLLLLLGMIVSYILTLRFSLAIFLLLDNHEMDAITAMKTSAQYMKGNKGRFFYLDISFFGMLLLGSLSAGIGLLWVQPYINVTTAYFYLEVTGKLKADGSASTVSEYQSYSMPNLDS